MTRINALVALVALSALVLPQPALALDQDDRQSLSRHGEASVEAFAKFGDVGETLTHISSRKFAGTGSQRREMSRRLDAALEPWKNASQSAKNSLSYKVLPHAFTVADEGMSMLGAAIEGDYRGAMGTAVSVAVEPSATAAGASVIGAIGTGIGATVGSFIPVVGTAGGAMVGGAIGTVAGGYICPVAYDIYIKEWVGKGVEAGLAGLFDDTKLHEALMARDQFLREQGADDLKAAWSQLRMVSKDFNPAGVELVGPGSTPYIVPPKPPLPDAQQQAALPPGGPSTVTGDIEIVVWSAEFPDYRVPATCRILAGAIQCQGSKTDPYLHMDYRFEGTITGSTAIGQFSETIDVRYQGNKCSHRYAITFQMRYDFDDGGRMRGTGSTGTQTLISNTCPDGRPASRATPAHTVIGEWKVR